jgi:hypothetical protein
MTTYERPLAFALLCVPFAWVTAVVLSDFPLAAFPLVVLAWAVCAAVAVASTLRAQYLVWWSLAILVGLTGAALVTSLHGSTGAELASGLLLGVPWVLAGFVARPTSSLGLRIAAFGCAVTAGLALLATSSEVAGGPAGIGGDAFVRGVFTVLADQAQVLGGLVTGAPAPVIPLHNFFDPVYAGLAATAMLGFLLVTVRPQSGQGVPLPISIRLRRDGPEGRSLPLTYGFSGAQQSVFFERSAVEPPLTAWPPGLASVLAGAAGAGVFLVLAYLDPLRALLVATLVLVAVSAGVVTLTERPGILRAPARRRRLRPIFAGASGTRFSREMLTSPSLPVNEPSGPPGGPGT